MDLGVVRQSVGVDSDWNRGNDRETLRVDDRGLVAARCGGVHPSEIWDGQHAVNARHFVDLTDDGT